MHQDPSGPGLKPDENGKNKDVTKKNQGEDNPMEGKCDKVSEIDLGVLEIDLRTIGILLQ